MAAVYGAVSISTSATLIHEGDSNVDEVVVQNVHATEDIYVGLDASVTTANGVKIPAGSAMSITLRNQSLYGIAAAAADARYLTTG
jgi:hypothetical protein